MLVAATFLFNGPRKPIETVMENLMSIWAGVECTVNRVGDSFFRQCVRNGHHQRLQDLELFAELGIERIRYPFLWEDASRGSLSEFDWSWADERTAELKRLGLVPIAGLVHHGSGPLGTDLMDPEFPEKLASYARQFARRFPWITDYTPVNEPNTTARFSGLYGVWYPHHKSGPSYLRCLYNQIRATVLCMQEIRQVNPESRLVQTEDLGKAQGTSPLQYQVEFENHRRWLSFDLLCGAVDRKHPLYDYFVANGILERELGWLLENPCPPDIIGINHYLLSSRFLDHRLEFYPTPFHGGNGRQAYSDVGVIDTTAAPLVSPQEILTEVWERYHLPFAVTEVHMLGRREDQMRWFHEVLRSAQVLRNQGADLRAVTAWSLLGAFDWNSLCTADHQFYESGVFDIRGPHPRPTALKKMIQSWAQGKVYDHPVLQQKGWWHHRDAAPYGPPANPKPIIHPPDSGKILIIGASGTLGRAFARICEKRHLPYVALTRQDLEITSSDSIRRRLDEIRPWAVINAAGYVRVDQAEIEGEKCFRQNVLGPRNLAEICSARKIQLLHFSTDLVFDGSSTRPYQESDPVGPLNIYGLSKLESEVQVLGSHPDSLVIRTSSFFGPWDTANFVFMTLKELNSGGRIEVASDLTITPTYVPDLVDISLDLLLDQETGLLHLTNQGQLTWLELAHKVAQMAMDHKRLEKSLWSPEKILAVQAETLPDRARRPKFSALTSERMKLLPFHEDALIRYFKETEPVLTAEKIFHQESSL
jgi:dTDP-4-dehydrorhamnose reductase